MIILTHDAGTRYVLVGFCLVEHEKLNSELKDWRWGEPEWYLRCGTATRTRTNTKAMTKTSTNTNTNAN